MQFHTFCSLPLELRLQIWEAAIPIHLPSVYEAKLGPPLGPSYFASEGHGWPGALMCSELGTEVRIRRTRWSSRFHLYLTSNPENMCPDRRSALQVLLRTSTESRRVALQAINGLRSHITLLHPLIPYLRRPSRRQAGLIGMADPDPLLACAFRPGDDLLWLKELGCRPTPIDTPATPLISSPPAGRMTTTRPTPGVVSLRRKNDVRFVAIRLGDLASVGRSRINENTLECLAQLVARFGTLEVIYIVLGEDDEKLLRPGPIFARRAKSPRKSDSSQETMKKYGGFLASYAAADNGRHGSQTVPRWVQKRASDSSEITFLYEMNQSEVALFLQCSSILHDIHKAVQNAASPADVTGPVVRFMEERKRSPPYIY